MSLKAIELRRFTGSQQKMTKWGRAYHFVAGVYFDESEHGSEILNTEPYHCQMVEWLEANTKESYHGNFMMGSYVFFQDMEEAMLCRVAFS